MKSGRRMMLSFLTASYREDDKAAYEEDSAED
jgi:hypothetical protein